MQDLLEWHIDSGTNGIVVSGTTGEAPTLKKEEVVELVKFSKKVIKGRVPLIVGSGTNSTSSSIELSQSVEEAGAEALLVVVPYYNKPSQEGMKAHFLAVADAVKLPIILYNVPGRTVADLLPETTLELAKHPRIIAIKEAKEYDNRIQDIISKCKGKLTLLSGDDLSAREFISLGGDGVISVSANLLPKEMSEMCAAALAGDATKALKIDQKMVSMHSDLFVEPNPCPTKWALEKMGKIKSETSRLPLLPLTKPAQAVMQAAMDKAGIDS